MYIPRIEHGTSTKIRVVKKISSNMQKSKIDGKMYTESKPIRITNGYGLKG